MHTPGHPCGPGSHQETTVKLRSEMWQHLVQRLQGVSTTGTTSTAPVSRRLIHSDTATTPVVSGRRGHGKRSRRLGCQVAPSSSWPQTPGLHPPRWLLSTPQPHPRQKHPATNHSVWTRHPFPSGTQHAECHPSRHQYIKRTLRHRSGLVIFYI